MMLKILGSLVLLPFGLYGLWKLSPIWLKRKILVKVFMTPSPPLESFKSYEEIVVDHGPLEQLAPNLWRVSGTFQQPGPKFNRNFTVCRLPNSNELVLHSVVALNESCRKELESLGTVAYIVIPSSAHKSDAHAYQEAYPEAKVICPEKTRSKLTGWVEVSDTAENALKDVPGIQIVHPKGTGAAFEELVYVLELENREGPAIVVNDLYFNISPESADFVTKFIGSAQNFGLTTAGKIMVEDMGVFREFTKRLQDLKGSVVIVAHGDIVVGEEKVKSEFDRCIKNLQL